MCLPEPGIAWPTRGVRGDSKALSYAQSLGAARGFGLWPFRFNRLTGTLCSSIFFFVVKAKGSGNSRNKRVFRFGEKRKAERE